MAVMLSITSSPEAINRSTSVGAAAEITPPGGTGSASGEPGCAITS